MGVRFDITDGTSAQLAQILLCPTSDVQGEWCQEGGSLAIGRYGRGRYGWVRPSSLIWLFEAGAREGEAMFVLRMNQIAHGLGALVVGERGACDIPSPFPGATRTPKGSSGGAKGATDPHDGGVSPPSPSPGAQLFWVVRAINVADNCTGRGRSGPPPGWFERVQQYLREGGR